LLGPESANSPNAEDINALYWIMLAIAGVLFLAINGALVALALRFRAKRGVAPRRLHSRPRAMFLLGGLFGTLAAIIFVVAVVVTEDASEVEASGPDGLQAAAGRTAQRDVSVPPDVEPLVIDATAQQWIWRYEYPGAENTDDVYSYYELVVPVDTAVVIELDSTDVVHRWFVPGLGGKFDAVPEQTNRTWFKAEEEGTYEGASYQFSGPAYSAMRTKVTVVSVEEYETWLEEQGAGIQEAQDFVQAQVEADTELADPDDADPAEAE
jgi:cytochrome c oxidase subunit II